MKKSKIKEYKQAQIIGWAKKHGRLPRRKSDRVIEARYGSRMENYLCSNSLSFDPEFRDLIYSLFARKVHNKRKHNKALRIKELIEFVQKNNRTPSLVVPEERVLVSSLWNYTRPGLSTYSVKLEKQILNIDRCYRTGIPKKFRKCINTALIEAESKLKEEIF
jgi:hypothetical protein